MGAQGDAGKRVLMVGPKTFPPVIGGIETHVYELSKRLASTGYGVKVVVPDSAGRPGTEKIEGVEVVRVRAVNNRYALKLSMMLSVARQIKDSRGAVVHAHDAAGGLVAAMFADRRRFVYTVHGLAFHKEEWPTPFRQGIRFMRKAALRRAAHVFCTDERTAEAVRSMRPRAEILSSGIDVQAYSKDAHSRPREFDPGRFTVLFVGRYVKAKGIEVMLKAIEGIPDEQRRRFSFVFLGDGPMTGDIQAAAARLGCIQNLGVIEHTRTAPYFVHADAFVLPSLTEGVPMALLEAMASGVPAVASKVGGVGASFSPEVVRLVEPGDPRVLAESLMWLEQNRADAKALGEKGRLFVAQRFSWDRVVKRVSEVYGDLPSV